MIDITNSRIRDVFTERALRFYTPFKITDQLLDKPAWPFAMLMYNGTAKYFNKELDINSETHCDMFMESIEDLGIEGPQSEHDCETWFKHLMARHTA